MFVLITIVMKSIVINVEHQLNIIKRNAKKKISKIENISNLIQNNVQSVQLLSS